MGHLSGQTLFRAFTKLPASGADGVAIVCCVAGVLALQASAAAWRAYGAVSTSDADAVLVRARASAQRERCRAYAEAHQTSASAALIASAFVALYGIVPHIATEVIGALALVGALYFIGDAYLSCAAEVRAIAASEAYYDFLAVDGSDPSPESWRAFETARPGTARAAAGRELPSISAIK